ncbi:MAG: hypothetical protein RW306_10030 [Geobacteraceae bacterium]|nr:hypothetical protein [Geobacteraceae bacterium]
MKIQGPDRLYNRIMNSHYEARLRAILVAGLFALAIAFWQYTEQFGCFIDKAGTKAEWGAFGDFIGGTTNPILSFLALMGIIWSISQAQKQNKADNLFKIIELIHAESTKLMESTTIVREGELGHPFEEKISLNDLVYKFDYDEKYHKDWQAVLIKVNTTITNLIILLIQLRVYLIKLEQQCKDKSESEFFKVRYYRIVDLFSKTDQVVPAVLIDFFSQRDLSYLSREATDLILKHKRDPQGEHY